MSLKMMLVAALALVMVSCGGTGGGGNAAAQKKSATASFRAISAIGSTLVSPITSLLSNKPRLQAGGTVNLECDKAGESGTVTVTSTDTSLALVLKTSAAGCTESGTTVTTPAAGLSMTFKGSGNFDANYSFTLAIDGSATITTGSSTETFAYTKFSIQIDVVQTGTSPSVTIIINGSVTSGGDTQTFNNETYDSTELN